MTLMSLVQQAEKCLAKQSTHAALNAFISCRSDPSRILQSAKDADERAQTGRVLSVIDGRLIAIKDNIVTKAQHTTCGSKLLRNYISPYDATVVQKLQAGGAIIAGKTNLDEFGLGSHSVNSAFGETRNHVESSDGPMSPGGSSGGSAVAVATQQCWAALGTDTGGSVRLPASYCGVVGFKPSYGEVSRHGVVAYANSLDTVGVLAPTVQAAKDVFDAIRGYDEKDPTSLPPRSRSRIQELIHARGSRKVIRVGVPAEFNIAELEPVVRTAWLQTIERLISLGHTVHQVPMPSTKFALSAYYVIAPAEASSNLAKYDGVRYGSRSEAERAADDVLFAATRGEGLGSEARRRILLGSYSLSAPAIDNYFIKAQKVRRLVQRDFDRAFALPNPLLDRSVQDADAETNANAGVDVLLSPTAPSLPRSLASLGQRAPTDSYGDDVLTVPASLAGAPALTVPVPVPVVAPCEPQDRDPATAQEAATVGLQITAQYGDDEMVLRAAETIEGAWVR